MRDRLTMRFDLSLDTTQLRLLAVMVIMGGVFVGAGLYEGDSYSARPYIDHERVARTCEFINPNVDGYASLRRLPGVGDMRARAIISYRQTCKNTPAFTKPEDLLKVHGIGAGTLRDAAPLLKF